jgi:hypothetical protein
LTGGSLVTASRSNTYELDATSGSMPFRISIGKPSSPRSITLTQGNGTPFPAGPDEKQALLAFILRDPGLKDNPYMVKDVIPALKVDLNVSREEPSAGPAPTTEDAFSASRLSESERLTRFFRSEREKFEASPIGYVLELVKQSGLFGIDNRVGSYFDLRLPIAEFTSSVPDLNNRFPHYRTIRVTAYDSEPLVTLRDDNAPQDEPGTPIDQHSQIETLLSAVGENSGWHDATLIRALESALSRSKSDPAGEDLYST